MPLYRCAVLRGRADLHARARIAKDVVRVHCGVTGAPPSFVHAFFSEVEREALPEGQLAFVLGSIRAGRTDEQKREIREELARCVAQAIGCEPTEVGVATLSVMRMRRTSSAKVVMSSPLPVIDETMPPTKPVATSSTAWSASASSPSRVHRGG